MVNEVGRLERGTNSQNVARLIERLNEAENSIAKMSHNQKQQTELLNDFDKQRDKNEVRLRQLETDLKTCRDVGNSNKNVADLTQKKMLLFRGMVNKIKGESRRSKIKDSERFERLERKIQELQLTRTVATGNRITPIEMGLQRIFFINIFLPLFRMLLEKVEKVE